MKSQYVTPHFIRRMSVGGAVGSCWLWRGYLQSGYYAQIRVDGKLKLVHRLSWEVHNGPIPEGMLVLHQCDRPPCVNPTHLFLGTQADNVHDCQQKGRLFFGSDRCDFRFTRRPRTRKITEEQAEEIRKSNWKLKHLAEKYGVSLATISCIRNGKRKNRLV